MDSLSNSDVIAISSVVIAVGSSVATAWQAWIARNHNRLSVRPKLMWSIARNNGENSLTVAFSVENLGLGPAIIKDRYFTVNGSRFRHTRMSMDEVSEVVEHVLAKKVPYALRKFGMPGVGSFVPSGEKIIVAVIDFPSSAPQQIKYIVDIFEAMDLHVKYESMYGEKFSFSTRDSA